MSISNLLTPERINELNEFQKKYNLDFSNLELLNQAFIHTSYVNENKIDVSFSYERLEFLGDAVLKLAVSDFYYEYFPDYQEGKMTKLRGEIVSDKNIFSYALELGFDDLIILGKNEKKHGGAKKESIIACAFEAFLGAIYLEYKENGYQKAKEFLKDNFLDDILNIDKKIAILNPKAILQEYTQAKNHKLPVYNLIETKGLEHDKTFYVEVVYNNEVLGKGFEKSLKQAQQEAALNALVNLKLIDREKI